MSFVEFLDKLEALGLEISDDNRSVKATTPLAEWYVENHLGEQHHYRNYVLGSVPAHNESLRQAEFDVMFTIIEHYAPKLSEQQYDEFHEYIQNHTPEQFMRKLKDMATEEEGVHEDMLDEIDCFIHNMCLEVEEMHYIMVSQGEVRQ